MMEDCLFWLDRLLLFSNNIIILYIQLQFGRIHIIRSWMLCCEVNPLVIVIIIIIFHYA